MTAANLLNPDDYEDARQARDPRFDGRFFVGVLTTGIYCRPVCPVKVPKKENVQLYRSAAAAAAAGFRPCLRCRPESSPGTPAWSGSSWKVSRALQLIDQGALDEASVEELAAQLEIGARQLSRLFHQHLGATPVEVAQTRRLHFAKKLLDETDLKLTEICFAAGFGSVRRFNAVFNKILKKIIRQERPNSGEERDGMPSSHASSLSFLAASVPLGLGVLGGDVPWEAWSAAASASATLFALGGSYQRIRSGRHTVPQVVAGYTVGTMNATLWNGVAMPRLASSPLLRDPSLVGASVVVLLFAGAAVVFYKKLTTLRAKRHHSKKNT